MVGKETTLSLANYEVDMCDIEEYVKEWNKLGYTREQSEELVRLSVLGSDGDIEAHIADKILYKTLKEFDTKKGGDKHSRSL